MDELDSNGRTEAPTNDATLARISAGAAGLTPEQRDFVSLINQFYLTNGEVMPLSVALERYFFEEEEFLELMNTPLVQAALDERGINFKHYVLEGFTYSPPVGTSPEVTDVPIEAVKPWTMYALTPTQLLVANVMLDLIDTRSQKKKLQDMGVSTRTYATWLKDETFQKYLRERAEAMLGENQHEAHLALLDKVRMGDIKAITYYNELTGRYVAERGGTNSGTNVQLDFKRLLVSVLEIINDEVSDPDVALAIAERFRTLMSVNRIADELVESTVAPVATISLPTVRANRELNPRLQEILEKGNNV